MKNQITSRDYELISAYLDNQLGSKDRTRFEARLKVEPELRKGLQEISKTRLLVRSLPRMRAPHNYFIKAETPIPRPTLRLAPVFGIVSAIASIVLVVVIFGSRLFASTTPAALAPASQNTTVALSVQQEVERSVAPTESLSEAPPALMMGAPAIEATPTINILSMKTVPTEPATPTTIYLNVYPPTSTPEGEINIFDLETDTAKTACEDYSGSGVYPTMQSLYNCPTPTSTLSLSIESLLAESTTPTPSETPTATPTPTPTPTATPTTSPTPTPTETPPPVLSIAPPAHQQVPTQSVATGLVEGKANPTLASQDQTATSSPGPNVSFLSYLLLTLEISLAAIAVIAGIIAIILRIRVR